MFLVIEMYHGRMSFDESNILELAMIESLGDLGNSDDGQQQGQADNIASGEDAVPCTYNMDRELLSQGNNTANAGVESAVPLFGLDDERVVVRVRRPHVCGQSEHDGQGGGSVQCAPVSSPSQGSQTGGNRGQQGDNRRQQGDNRRHRIKEMTRDNKEETGGNKEQSGGQGRQ